MKRRRVLAALGATGLAAVAGLGIATDDPVRYTYATSHSCDSGDLDAEWRESYTRDGETILLENTTAEAGENTGQETTADEPAVINLSNVLPGDKGTVSFNLTASSIENDTVEPTLGVVLEETAENGINEPEEKAGDTTENEGELQEFLDVKLWEDDGLLDIDWLGANNVAEDIGETVIAEGTLQEVADEVDNHSLGTIDSTGGQVAVAFRWEFPDDTDINITQGDSVKFTLDIGCQ